MYGTITYMWFIFMVNVGSRVDVTEHQSDDTSIEPRRDPKVKIGFPS